MLAVAQRPEPLSGDTIRTLRKARSLTQVELAAAVPVSQRTVRRWEQNHVRPSLLALVRLRAILRGDDGS